MTHPRSFMEVFSDLCICFNFINGNILFWTFMLPTFTLFFLLYLRLNLCDVTMAVHFIHWEICQYLPFLPNMFISFHYGFQWNSQIYFACIDSPNRPRPSSCQDSTIAPWQTTLAITPLDEWSARCRDIYLITHSIHKKQTSMPTAAFELTIPAS